MHTKHLAGSKAPLAPMSFAEDGCPQFASLSPTKFPTFVPSFPLSSAAAVIQAQCTTITLLVWAGQSIYLCLLRLLVSPAFLCTVLAPRTLVP